MADLPFISKLKFAIASFIFKLCQRPDGTINRHILDLFDPKTSANTTVNVQNTPISSSDVSIDPSRDLWFRLFAPQTADVKLPLIIYFHGGGFSFFRPNSKPCHHFCLALAGKLPAVVISINYRLAPEHKYPCQYDDGYDALKFINDENYKILPSNTNTNRCFIAGDSAGGNLAHHVAFRAAQNHHMFDQMKIDGLICVQPFFGGEERTESELRLINVPPINMHSADKLWERFLPVGADRNHPAVNVFGDEKILDTMKSVKFPRSLVIVGGKDPLQDWIKRYVEGLKKCGKEVEMVEYANAGHGFYSLQDLPEFGLLIEDVRKFVYKHFS